MDAFQDRVAVITGGGSGIGAAMARVFADEGMRIVLADIETEAMDTVAASLPTDVLCVRTDTSKLHEVRALADQAFERFGAVHVDCNNAGVGMFGPIASMTQPDR